VAWEVGAAIIVGRSKWPMMEIDSAIDLAKREGLGP
jgi:hypothetical protein